jgi:hypothetical protein
MQISIQELLIKREITTAIATPMNPNGGKISKIKSVTSKVLLETHIERPYEIGSIIMVKNQPYQLDVVIEDPVSDIIIYQVHKYEEARQCDPYGNEVFALLPLVTMVEREGAIPIATV